MRFISVHSMTQVRGRAMTRATLALIVLCGATLGDAAAAPALVISPQHERFADSYQFSTIRQNYTVTNQGTATVVLKRIEARSGIGNIIDNPKQLAAGASGQIVVEVPVGAAIGDTSFRFALFTDEPSVDRYRFTLSGFVQSAFDPEVSSADFGTLNRGDTPTREIEIASREAADWTFGAVVEQPDFVKVSINGKRITVGLLESTPPGFISGRVLVRSTVPQQPMVVVAITGFVLGELILDEKAVNVGAVELGSTVQQSFNVRTRQSLALKGQLRAEVKPPWHTRIKECPSPSSDCVAVELSGKPASVGPIGDTIMLERKGSKDPPLPVHFFGLAVNPGQPIKQIDARDAGSEENPIEPAARNPLQAALHPQTIATAPAPPSAAPPVAASPENNQRATTGGGPARLHWSASNDSQIYGYVVYRAEDRAGPFQRISTEIVHALRDAEQVHKYVFEDGKVLPGKTYYYYVDSVGTRGQRSRFMPVVEKTVR
ncbi:MAG: hypothetical protein ABI411_01045 [Tahibacter sp.]